MASLTHPHGSFGKRLKLLHTIFGRERIKLCPVVYGIQIKCKITSLTLMPEPLSCICSIFSPPCRTVTCMLVAPASKLQNKNRLVAYSTFKIIQGQLVQSSHQVKQRRSKSGVKLDTCSVVHDTSLISFMFEIIVKRHVNKNKNKKIIEKKNKKRKTKRQLLN